MHVDWALLLKYFQKRCSEKEIMQIENWRNSNPVHQKFFEEMEEIWHVSGDLYSNYEVNRINGWEKLSNKLSLSINQDNLSRVKLKQFLRMAAMFILLVSIGFIVKFYIDKANTERDVISFRAENKKTDILLPDSSLVTLDKHALLKYRKGYNGTQREVDLKGTAFFSVKGDVSKPFVVNMEGCAVKVVGTSFYLNADSVSKQITLIVVSGKVQFYATSKADSFVVVSKNEKAMYAMSTGKIIKEQKYNPNEIVWKTGNFIFEEEKLINVCNILSSYYAVKISLSDTSLNELRLTAGFNEQRLPDIIEAIETTFDISADTVGHTIVLSK
jgi:ferric-dicitrate binding protein FerR (iron transport regulator)